MKIYCNRQPKSKEEILRSIEGKDLWIKIKLKSPLESIYWLQVREIVPSTDNASTEVDLICKGPAVSNSFVNDVLKDIADGDLTEDNLRSYIEYSPEYDYTSLDKFDIATPVDIVTTEELIQPGINN